jgi:alkyl sulfatase BDS1-like metallo-beta-lactamase superfamily hydrolase
LKPTHGRTRPTTTIEETTMTMKSICPRAALALLAAAALLSACGRNPGVGGAAGDATPATVAANEAVAKSLALDDPKDFEDAKRGLIARPEGKILAADGSTVLIDFDAYKFVDGKAPPTVNPSLWRHAVLNAQTGLFKVTDGIWQVRGFDIANMTLVEGKTGFIVIDPLTARESAAAALAFARKHLGDKPGVGDRLHAQPCRPLRRRAGRGDGQGGGRAQDAGHCLGRLHRRGHQREHPGRHRHGAALDVPVRQEPRALGQGQRRHRTGQERGLRRHRHPAADAADHDKPTQELTLDGVRFVFHNVPGAEAPAEMTFSIPEKKAYGGAENLAQTMHNLLPVRGAKVRDALRWAEYMQQALDQLGDAEVYFGQHNWPIWGRERIAEFITKHRDVYKYTHDQTVRLINAGNTPREIADMVKLPPSLARTFGARGYYGDLRHNVKAVYQFYLGAYDGNPANLNPLPPQESAKRYLELLGGADKAVLPRRRRRSTRATTAGRPSS